MNKENSAPVVSLPPLPHSPSNPEIEEPEPQSVLPPFPLLNFHPDSINSNEPSQAQQQNLIDLNSMMDGQYFNFDSGNHFQRIGSSGAGTGDSFDTHLQNMNMNIGKDDADGNGNKSLELDDMTSSSTKLAQRAPSFMELGNQLKQLQQENFQLKLRIYIHESKHGRPIAGISQDAASVSATTEITREFNNLKQSNETLQLKVIELENVKHKQEQVIRDAFRREDTLRSEVHTLTQKLDIMERELTLTRLKHTESDEVEKCLRAFSMASDGAYLSPGKSNSESEERLQKIHSLMDEINELQQQIEDLRHELHDKHIKMMEFETVAQEKTQMLAQLDTENEKLREKQSALITALKGIGISNAQKDELCQQLKAENEELRQIHERTCNSLKELKKVGMETNLSNQEVHRQDSSPDLGVWSESGQEVHLPENVLKISNGKTAKPNEIEILRLMNKELASKLKYTRQTLAKTMEKLESATKNREEVEKAICRHLHKTHTILRHAKKGLETPSEHDPPI